MLQSLLIFQQRWQNITINFIIELLLLKNYNVICMIICCLFKERHYVLCHWEDNDISIEETVWIMLWNVYWLHDLLSSIVLNRDSQFILIIWQSLCKWLKIKVNLSTVYHSEINDQLKWANQDVECKLWIYCYNSSYASSLIAMLMTMLMIILRIIVDRSSLKHRLVSKSTLFKVNLCSSESYK